MLCLNPPMNSSSSRILLGPNDPADAVGDIHCNEIREQNFNHLTAVCRLCSALEKSNGGLRLCMRKEVQ